MHTAIDNRHGRETLGSPLLKAIINKLRRALRVLVDMFAAFLGLTHRNVAISEARVDQIDPLRAAAFACYCSVAVYAAAHFANGSRLGEAGSVIGFYGCVAALFMPAAVWIIHPGTFRSERIGILLILTASLFLLRVARAPVAFIDHDEFLHWATSNDILEAHRLFLPNPLLPVSPLYPGLELLTTAVTNVSGASLFVSALVVLFAARMSLMLSLFLLAERLTKSARAAAVTCIVYMGSSAFLIFDVHYSYESLALPLLVATLLAAQESLSSTHAYRWRFVACAVLILCALAVTHHLTSFFALTIIVAVALLELMRRCAEPRQRHAALVLAVAAIAAPIGWSTLMGHPTGGYLGPALASGFQEVLQLIAGSSTRKLFVSDTGNIAPAWQRYTTMAGVVLICLALLMGFLRSFVLNSGAPHLGALLSSRWRAWHSSLLIVLTVVTIGYPVSIIFRLTRSGWEMGNRIGSLSFLGVSIIAALTIVCLWQNASRSWLRAVVVSVATTTIVVAGVISSEGPRILVPQYYEVSSDSSSIEPMGVQAAEWTRVWLSPGNLFATDRINRLLVSTYGRQKVATTLENPLDTSIAITSPELGRLERALLVDLQVQYVLADLRLSTDLPGVGVYFDGGADDRNHQRPPLSSSLLKFNNEANVSRVFDNGFLVIFDVMGLDGNKMASNVGSATKGLGGDYPFRARCGGRPLRQGLPARIRGCA